VVYVWETMMHAPLLSDVSDRYGRLGDLDSQDSASQAFLQCLITLGKRSHRPTHHVTRLITPRTSSH
jgi:hypothetical protein